MELKYDRTKKLSAIKQDIVMKAKHIYDSFQPFTEGVRVLIMMHRPKEGGKDGGYKASIKRVVSRDTDEFLIELTKLVDEKEKTKDIPYRIYSCVNERDIEKAIRKFKFDMLESDYYDDESRQGFYFDVKNRFISSLMVPASAVKNKFFLLDVDNEEGRDVNGETLQELERLGIIIEKMYFTKNGSHIITKPFNPNTFNVPGVTINTDGLLLLDF